MLKCADEERKIDIKNLFVKLLLNILCVKRKFDIIHVLHHRNILYK